MTPSATLPHEAEQKASTSRRRLEARALLGLTMLAVVGGILLRLWAFSPALARSPDERTYTRQSNTLLTAGTAGLRALGEQLAQRPAEVGTEPAPTRVGYLLASSAAILITRDHTEVAGARLSIVCSVLTLGLVGWFSWRMLSPLTAAIATLLYAVFPFDLVTSRRAWQDSFIAFLSIAILCLATRLVRANSRGRIVEFIGFVFAGFLACITKENAAIFFILCGLGACLHAWVQRSRSEAIVLLASTASALLAAVALDSVIFGGVRNFFLLQRVAQHYSGVNPYDLAYDAGPLWMFPAALFRTSPLVTIGSLLGAIVIVRRSVRLSRADLSLGVLLLTFFILLTQVVTGRYNFRYTAPVFATSCILAGIGLSYVLQYLAQRLAGLGRVAVYAILCFAMAVGALRDFNFARDQFLETGMQDLALRPVLGVPPFPAGADSH